jgi:LAO/AO transport system kinase
VNKADREGVDRTVMALKMMLNLGVPEKFQVMHHGRMLPVDLPETEKLPQGWTPPIIKTVATTGEGTEALADAIESHRLYLEQSGGRILRDRLRAATELRMILRDYLLEHLLDRVDHQILQNLVEAVARRQVDPYTAVDQLVHQPDR